MLGPAMRILRRGAARPEPRPPLAERQRERAVAGDCCVLVAAAAGLVATGPPLHK